MDYVFYAANVNICLVTISVTMSIILLIHILFNVLALVNTMSTDSTGLCQRSLKHFPLKKPLSSEIN